MAFLPSPTFVTTPWSHPPLQYAPFTPAPAHLSPASTPISPRSSSKHVPIASPPACHVCARTRAHLRVAFSPSPMFRDNSLNSRARACARACHSYPHPCSVTTPCTPAGWGPYSSHPWHVLGHPTRAVLTLHTTSAARTLHNPTCPPFTCGQAHFTLFLNPSGPHCSPLKRKNWSCFVSPAIREPPTVQPHMLSQSIS